MITRFPVARSCCGGQAPSATPYFIEHSNTFLTDGSRIPQIFAYPTYEFHLPPVDRYAALFGIVAEAANSLLGELIRCSCYISYRVDVPQGATIQQAYFGSNELYGITGYNRPIVATQIVNGEAAATSTANGNPGDWSPNPAGEAKALIRGHDVDFGFQISAPVGGGPGSYDGAPRTTAVTPLVLSYLQVGTSETYSVIGDPGVIGEPYQYPDVTAIVQEIVDRPGWVSGNVMGFFFDEDGSDTGQDTSSLGLLDWGMSHYLGQTAADRAEANVPTLFVRT